MCLMRLSVYNFRSSNNSNYHTRNFFEDKETRITELCKNCCDNVMLLFSDEPNSEALDLKIDYMRD